MSAPPADFVLRCPSCGSRRPLPDGDAARSPCPSCGQLLREEGGILFLDDVAGAGDYPPSVYDAIAPFEPRHWWHASRNEVIRLALAPEQRRRRLRTLVEVGCGTGFVLAHLEALGFSVCGLDMQVEGLRHARTRTRAPLLRSGRAALPFAESVDVVALCDVLEHAEEEPLLAACAQLLRRARPAPTGGGEPELGGLLLVTVPALPALWALEDELAGHKRRYTRASLRAALESAGLRVVLLRPFHALLTPLALWHRRSAQSAERDGRAARPEPAQFFARELRPPARPVGAALRSALWLENRLGTLLPLPFGSSLLALAERAE